MKIARQILKFPVWFYRAAISPLIAPRCRYLPTCSAYALEALEKHGAGKGIYLAAARFLSCHPWTRRHRHDPVPEEFAWGEIVGYKRRHNGKKI